MGRQFPTRLPARLKPALPELPELATELSGFTEAAKILYDDEDLDKA